MRLAPGNDGLLAISPRADFPTNKGGLCQKGWTAADLLMHPDRLTTPLIRRRKGEPLHPVSWDEALTRIASEIGAAQALYGRDSVGVFGGGGLTNEKSYLLGKFARVALRTSNIDYNGRFCMSSAAAAGLRTFGIDRGLPFPLEDISRTQAILLVGSNNAETMPPMMQYFETQRENGGVLIVADPRLTATAKAGQLHLQLTPGTDAALGNGLLHIAVTDKLIDLEFIAERTSGFESVRRTVNAYWPDRVERITGVPIRKLTDAAHLLGEASTAMIMTARGPEQQSTGVANAQSFINLALALGKAGKPYCGYGCVTGQGNGQGGREHGQKADQLPGYRKIDNPEHREHVAKVWGIDPAEIPGKGKSAWEMIEGLGSEGGVRAMMVLASNLVVSAPRSSRVEERLSALDFLCVSDIFLSETAMMADVVLPCAQWAEESGTMTNLEGRVILRQQATAPPDGVWTDAQLLCALAERLGRGQYFPSAEPMIIFDELRRASAGGAADYSGISYQKIREEKGVFWPCSPEQPNGTPRMFLERFGTDDGRARFHAVQYIGPAEQPDGDYPMYLTTGRVMAQYQSGTQTRRVAGLRALVPEPFVEIHPSAAARFGIQDGEWTTITTRRGSAQFNARVVNTIRPDTLFVPFHFAGKGRANLLTNTALDPTSKMPEFKVCAALIAPSVRQDVVVGGLVGAGVGSADAGGI